MATDTQPTLLVGTRALTSHEYFRLGAPSSLRRAEGP
jgi:hypothetical protein